MLMLPKNLFQLYQLFIIIWVVFLLTIKLKSPKWLMVNKLLFLDFYQRDKQQQLQFMEPTDQVQTLFQIWSFSAELQLLPLKSTTNQVKPNLNYLKMLENLQLLKSSISEPKEELLKLLKSEKKCKKLCKDMLQSSELRKFCKKVVIKSIRFIKPTKM